MFVGEIVRWRHSFASGGHAHAQFIPAFLSALVGFAHMNDERQNTSLRKISEGGDIAAHPKPPHGGGVALTLLTAPFDLLCVTSSAHFRIKR